MPSIRGGDIFKSVCLDEMITYSILHHDTLMHVESSETTFMKHSLISEKK